MEPAGATVVVFRRTGRGVEYLLLHRGDAGADDAGDWVWTPPAGEREAGESVERCAARELEEETGLRIAGSLDCAEASGWPAYLVEAPDGWEVRLSDEHDRFEWLPLEAALARVLPEVVRAQLRRVGAELEGRTVEAGPDPGEPARLAAAVMAALEAAVAGSRAALRGSLAEGRGDAWSDLDVLWVVPDGAFAAAVESVGDVLASVRAVESLRADPDLQRSARRRLLFARFAHTPLFRRLDLDLRAASVAEDDAFDLANPAARGDDWSRGESALANAVAAVKMERRGRPAEAARLLDRAFGRVGIASAAGDMATRVRALAAAVAEVEPSLTALAARVATLADEPT
jgi:8-oxo-dGTP pyrophosphatase MutT (NUDIX family)